MNSPLLAAMRQASVAISRERVTARRRILSAQTLSASRVRFMAARRQRARAQHAFAEADDAREGVDDEEAAPRGLGDEQPAIIGAEIERAINRRRMRPRLRARVFLALGCRREAMGRRVRTRPGCDLRWATSPAAVAGLVSLGLAVERNHGSRARIAARPIHGVQPLTPGTAGNSSACRASGVLVLCR